MLADILRSGFAGAHQRAGLIFLDLLWKLIWLAATTAILFFAAMWLTSDLSGIAWEDTGIDQVNALLAVSLLREFMNAKREEAVMLGALAVCSSGLVWLVLEALFRRSFTPASTFPTLFVANAAKTMLLVAAGILLAGAAYAGAVVIAIVTFIALAFALTLIDTLIRTDALELLGTDLIRVAGLIGILMSFESMIAASCVALLLAGFFNVAGATDAFVMLGAAAAVVLFLNVLHGYLLLVRFSAIAIMRQNVVEI